MKLTTRGRGLGVGKEGDAGLALVDEGFERRLGAIVGLDLAAEALKVDGVADRELGRGSGGAVGARGGRRSLLLGRGLGLGGLGGGSLGRPRLLRRGRRRRRRGLALAKFDGHGELEA